MQSDEDAKIQTEKELTELSILKNNGKSASFYVKDTERFSLWKVALAQRYSQTNLEEQTENFTADIEEENDPVIKIRSTDIKLLLTVRIFFNTKNITAQGSYIQKWIDNEWPKLAPKVNGELYHNIFWKNDWFEDTRDNDYSQVKSTTVSNNNSNKEHCHFKFRKKKETGGKSNT